MRGIRGSAEGVGGVGGIGVEDGLGAKPYWAPVHGPSTPTGSLGSDLPHQGQARASFQGPIIPTGFPWGMTEMSSAGYYIHLVLYLVTVCTFVSTLSNHIFLHTM